MTQSELLSLIPKRYASAHKGSFGRLLLIAGSENMCGCLSLAAEGALRSGVGILECASDPQALIPLKNRLSEPIYTPIPDIFAHFEDCADILLRRLPSADAIAVGPGLAGGKPDSPLGEALRDLIFLLLSKSDCPVILDADGLTVFRGCFSILKPFGERIVITPHPGELSALTGISVPAIQNGRAESAKRFAAEYGCVTLLKGHETVVCASDGRMHINTTGNPYMARGGSGDVLTGIIGSLLAQGIPPFEGACLGAYLHGGAGDLAAEELGLSMLPSDIPLRIGNFIRGKDK